MRPMGGLGSKLFWEKLLRALGLMGVLGSELFGEQFC